MTGTRKAPINLVFLATPSSLDSCLRAAGWHAAQTTRWQTVFEAYRDVLLSRGNPAAPLSPWFWSDRTPLQQWSRPDGPDRVFDRSFLRIWRTSLTAAGGTDVLVASTGHEHLPSWHLVPEVDAAFDHSRGQLLKQLAQTRGVAGTEPFEVPDDKNASRTGPLYEGERSVVRLKACRANMQIKPGK
ncbi:LssY C-terminal domain-containing protein [Marinobacter koreensis]|uniref:LssY C-terminal domain-containing protein n=1 Tax=Marinobacter koreensis TaxID=335974 RepID=UPI00362158BA